jgi:hypothetical protein
MKDNSIKIYSSLFEMKKEKWYKEWRNHIPNCSQEFQDWLNKRIDLVGGMNVFTLDYFICQEVGITISSGYDDDILWAKYEKRMDEEIEKLLRKEKLEKIKSKL